MRIKEIDYGPLAPLADEEREIAAMGLVNLIANFNTTGDVIRDDEETYEYELTDNLDDCVETLVTIIRKARAIANAPRGEDEFDVLGPEQED
jgi:hypothetical protein